MNNESRRTESDAIDRVLNRSGGEPREAGELLAENSPSPPLLALLRHVRKHGALNVHELATALARDDKNVHQDVALL